MKTKFISLLILCQCLFPLTITGKGGTKHIQKIKKEKAVTRVPYQFDFTAYDTENCLQIIFEGDLPDAQVIVMNGHGTIVYQQAASDIHDGQTISIFNANEYPYFVEITSPVMDISAKITDEEE